MLVSCYYIFLFETVLIIHMAYKVFQEYIYLVCLSIWLFVSLFVCPSVRPFQLLDHSFTVNVFIVLLPISL